MLGTLTKLAIALFFLFGIAAVMFAGDRRALIAFLRTL